MAIAQHLAEAHLRGTIDARMVFRIADQVIVASHERADRAEVRLETRSKYDRVLLADEAGKFSLEFKMQIEVAVEEARAGATRSVLLNRLDSRLHDLWARRQPEVVVGAEHDAALAFHDDNSILARLEAMEIRIDPRLARLLRPLVSEHLVEEPIHHSIPSVPSHTIRVFISSSSSIYCA